MVNIATESGKLNGVRLLAKVPVAGRIKQHSEFYPLVIKHGHGNPNIIDVFPLNKHIHRGFPINILFFEKHFDPFENHQAKSRRIGRVAPVVRHSKGPAARSESVPFQVGESDGIG